MKKNMTEVFSTTCATHCYKSTSDASKQLGLNEGSIRCVLCGSKPTLNGIRWIYLDQ